MVKSETKKPSWGLTQEAFDVLLTRLHADREQAGGKYEVLRLKLSYFFEARACALPDALVDETINRLAHKIRDGEDVRNLDAFALAIARFVWLEARREESTVALDELLARDELAVQQHEGDDERLAVMQQCVEQLPAPTRELLREYYQKAQAEQRREMAASLGISDNALYLKIHRVRQKLAKELATRLPRA